MKLKGKKLTVEDIMTTTVIQVEPKTHINEVAQLLNKYGIHGIPVVRDEKLAGIITESDFFIKNASNLHLPSYLDFLAKAEFHKRLSRREKKEVEKLMQATAKDIMSKKCETVRPTMPIRQLIKKFKTKHIYTMPVVKGKKMVGIVTLADIVKLIK